MAKKNPKKNKNKKSEIFCIFSKFRSENRQIFNFNENSKKMKIAQENPIKIPEIFLKHFFI